LGALGLPGEREDLARVVRAEPLRNPRQARAQAGTDLAAVAPRSAPADPLGLEQHHLEAALGQIERRRDPGETAADDTDIGGNFSL